MVQLKICKKVYPEYFLLSSDKPTPYDNDDDGYHLLSPGLAGSGQIYHLIFTSILQSRE